MRAPWPNDNEEVDEAVLQQYLEMNDTLRRMILGESMIVEADPGCDYYEIIVRPLLGEDLVTGTGFHVTCHPDHVADMREFEDLAAIIRKTPNGIAWARRERETFE